MRKDFEEEEEEDAEEDDDNGDVVEEDDNDSEDQEEDGDGSDENDQVLETLFIEAALLQQVCEIVGGPQTNQSHSGSGE